MLKYILPAIMLASASLPMFADDEKSVEPTDSVTGFVFTDVTLVPTGSVKDQNKSGTCWCFASTSFFEDEIRREKGIDVDLSEMFTVRHCYSDKADKYVRMYGATNFGPGGSVMDLPYVIDRYGIVPESAYPGLNYGEDKHVHGELDAVLDGYVKAVKNKPNKRITTAWRKGFDSILDAYLGELPEEFTVDGVTYTPQSYAKALGIDTGNYIALTSFTHHPFYKEFPIEVADNWLWEQNMNVPMDEMKAAVDYALEHGYPVVWGADVSEGGFKWYDGYALMPKPIDEGSLEGTELDRWVKLSDKDRQEKQFDISGPTEEIEVTQESRQEMFDRQETTDDHGMEIVGIATDQNGNRYYKVKNSWDTNQVYDGYFYVSTPYFLAKTINVYLNKKGLPSDLKKKIGVK